MQLLKTFRYRFSYLYLKDDKGCPCSAEDPSSIPGSGRSPREGNNYPLQYSGLENSMDGGSWQAIVHGFTKSQTR